jgi:hypothetical protein
MPFLSSVLAAFAALSLAGLIGTSAPRAGATPVDPGTAQTNEGPSDWPPKR